MNRVPVYIRLCSLPEALWFRCLLAVLWLGAAAGCSRDETETPLYPDDGGTDKKVAVVASARTLADEGVTSVRVIVFSNKSSEPNKEKTLASNQLYTGSMLTADLRFATYVGYSDFYLIADEQEDLSGVTTVAELNGKKYQRAGNTLFPCLYAEYKGVYVKDFDQIRMPGSDEFVSALDIRFRRAAARLTVHFDMDTEVIENGVPTGQYFVPETMEIEYIPLWYYLVPRIYDPADTYSTASFDLTASAPDAASHWYAYDSGDIYLPENLLRDASTRTEVIITGKIGSATCVYRLPVGDAMNTAQTGSDRWDIQRNRHYRLNIKRVVGYGEPSLETSATVAAWNEEELPVNVSGEDFILVDTKEVDVKSLRFFTYLYFTASREVTLTLAGGVTVSNVMSVTVEFDDETKKSGRVGFKIGNWKTGEQAKNTSYTVNLRSGTASTEVKARFHATRYAAKNNNVFGPCTWAEAMGYLLTANSARVGYFSAQYYRLAGNTGCAAYYEDGENNPETGKGCWRVATIREVNASPKVLSASFWAVEEADVSGEVRAYYAYPSGELMFYPDRKTSSLHYRCVLDVRPPELWEFEVAPNDVLNVTKEEARKTCEEMAGGLWYLPYREQMRYAYEHAGTNGVPNNFFADSYWGKEYGTEDWFVATMSDPEGLATTPDMLDGRHAVRCVKDRQNWN